LPLRIIFASLNCAFVLLIGVVASAAELALKFQTDPALALLRPFTDTVTLSVVVTGASGMPVERGTAVIALDAPMPGAFLTTDIPFVEGTRLLDVRLPFTQGRVEWKQLLPIRGVYRLSVSITAADGSIGRQRFEFSLPEKRQKWFWLGLFCAVLFFVGVVAGRIFTQGRGPTNALIIAFFVAASEFTAAHEAVKTTDQEILTGAVEVAPASVGKLTRIRWRGSPERNQPALLSLSIVHLEKRKTVLAFERVGVEKDFSFDFHFPDGAEYLITTTAEAPGRAAERAEQKVSVTGFEPSLTTQLSSLALFLTVIALGLGAGRASKRLTSQIR
jgi:hypothetical protein